MIIWHNKVTVYAWNQTIVDVTLVVTPEKIVLNKTSISFQKKLGLRLEHNVYTVCSHILKPYSLYVIL